MKNDPQNDTDMLTEKKAAAYFSPPKYKINKIQKGDKVFLYRSGEGIVAMGKGTGITKKKSYNGYPDEEYYTHLDDFNI